MTFFNRSNRKSRNKFGLRLKPYRDEHGQALLLVIVALTVALAVGVSTAMRTISSVSRVSTVDTSSRVLAAAEGGIEHFLSYTTAELNKVATVAASKCDTLDNSSAKAHCVINFPHVAGDNISARTVVKVEEYKGSLVEGNMYRTSVEQGHNTTINMAGFSGQLKVCWIGESDIFYTLFKEQILNDWTKGIVCGDTSNSGCYSGTIGVEIKDKGASPVVASSSLCAGLGTGYVGFTITVPAGGATTPFSKGLSITALNDRISLAVTPESGLFNQLLAYKITSKGELISDSVVKTSKTVVAVKSLPYLPASLLFGVFAGGGVITN